MGREGPSWALVGTTSRFPKTAAVRTYRSSRLSRSHGRQVRRAAGASSRENQRPAVVSTNAGAAATPGRAFAIVFDDVNLTRAQADEARKAVIHFLDAAASPDDTVSLVTTGGAVWLTARLPQDRERLLAVLSRVQGRFVPDTTAERMSDYEAMRIHELSDSTVEARVRRRDRITA